MTVMNGTNDSEESTTLNDENATFDHDNPRVEVLNSEIVPDHQNLASIRTSDHNNGLPVTKSDQIKPSTTFIFDYMDHIRSQEKKNIGSLSSQSTSLVKMNSTTNIIPITSDPAKSISKEVVGAELQNNNINHKIDSLHKVNSAQHQETTTPHSIDENNIGIESHDSLPISLNCKVNGSEVDSERKSTFINSFECNDTLSNETNGNSNELQRNDSAGHQSYHKKLNLSKQSRDGVNVTTTSSDKASHPRDLSHSQGM